MIDLIVLSRTIASFDKLRRPGISRQCTCAEAQLSVTYLAVVNGRKVRTTASCIARTLQYGRKSAVGTAATQHGARSADRYGLFASIREG